MYDLTLGQNGQFNNKNHVFFMAHAFNQSKLILLVNIDFIQVDIFGKL
jgi:hypothetical protein